MYVVANAGLTHKVETSGENDIGHDSDNPLVSLFLEALMEA
jgi:hypothetical protein